MTDRLAMGCMYGLTIDRHTSCYDIHERQPIDTTVAYTLLLTRTDQPRIRTFTDSSTEKPG